MTKLQQFLQGHPKAAFSEKAQTGDQRKFFKKSLKKMPFLKRPKSTLVQTASSSNQYALKVQRLERILAQTAALKVPEWPIYKNFCKVTQIPHFWKSAEGGTKGNFSKIGQKKNPRLKGPKARWRKWHYPLISMHLNCKDWKTFWRKQRLQKCPNGQVMAILARSPKPAFSEKVQRGDQMKFFKNRPKGSPCLKNP